MTQSDGPQYLPDIEVNDLISDECEIHEKQLVWRSVFRSLDGLSPEFEPGFIHD